jgi:hypothetical protein
VSEVAEAAKVINGKWNEEVERRNKIYKRKSEADIKIDRQDTKTKRSFASRLLCGWRLEIYVKKRNARVTRAGWRAIIYVWVRLAAGN